DVRIAPLHDTWTEAMVERGGIDAEADRPHALRLGGEETQRRHEATVGHRSCRRQPFQLEQIAMAHDDAPLIAYHLDERRLRCRHVLSACLMIGAPSGPIRETPRGLLTRTMESRWNRDERLSTTVVTNYGMLRQETSTSARSQAVRDRPRPSRTAVLVGTTRSQHHDRTHDAGR